MAPVYNSFKYACECGRAECDRVMVMPHSRYVKRAADGPVVHAGCPSLREARREAAATLNDWMKEAA